MKPLVKPAVPQSRAEELAIEKLELELTELRRKWWQRTSYLQVLLPLTVAVITASGALLISWSNGYFDLQKVRLQQERTRLVQENAEITSENAELQAYMKQTQDRLAVAESEQKKANDKLVEINKQITLSQKLLDDVRKFNESTIPKKNPS
jgi:uncharacterized protein HemX